MTDVFHGNLHDISDLIATFQNMLSAQQNTESNTGNTATNTGNTSTNTSTAGAGANTENINNKMLSATKTTQTMGFISSGIVEGLSTTSTTYVTAITVSAVPNNAKIAYNFFYNCNQATYTIDMEIIASSTVLWSNAYTGDIVTQSMDYSGTLLQSSGATNNVLVQYKCGAAGQTVYFGWSTSQCCTILCWNGANAIILKLTYIPGSMAPVGSCQLSAIGFAVMGNSQPPATAFGTLSIPGGASGPSHATGTYPNKQAYPNGVGLITATDWSDPNLFILIDFTGDLLTVT